MSELTDRLIKLHGDATVAYREILNCAAANKERIEALEAALREIADLRYSNTSAATIASAALAPEQNK